DAASRPGRHIEAGPAAAGTDIEQALARLEGETADEHLGLSQRGVAIGAVRGAQYRFLQLGDHRRRDAVTRSESLGGIDLVPGRHRSITSCRATWLVRAKRRLDATDITVCVSEHRDVDVAE